MEIHHLSATHAEQETIKGMARRKLLIKGIVVFCSGASAELCQCTPDSLKQQQQHTTNQSEETHDNSENWNGTIVSRVLNISFPPEYGYPCLSFLLNMLLKPKQENFRLHSSLESPSYINKPHCIFRANRKC